MTERVDQQAVIVDRGFQKYEGRRLGGRATTRAIIKDGVREIMGIRRKARRKILFWLLIGFVVLYMAALLALIWVGQVQSNLLGGNFYVEPIGFLAFMGLVLSAYAGPELLIPDRKSGTLSIYFSRPVTRGQYLLAKSSAFIVVLLGFLLIPLFVYHLVLAAISSSGFFAYLRDNLDVLWQIPASTLGYLVTYGAVAMLIGAAVNRVGMATAIILVIFFGGTIAAEIAFGTARWIALLALDLHVHHIRDWIFGLPASRVMVESGFDPWVSMLAVLVLAALSVFLVSLRYRRPI